MRNKSYNYGGPLVKDASHGDLESVATLPNNIYGVVSVSATKKYFYALYSGRSRASFGERSIFSDKVLVYTWDGNPVIIIQLNEGASTGPRLAIK